jgi:hypothetical protein
MGNGSQPRPLYREVTWAPASAGVTIVVLDAHPTDVIPAEAGTQCTEQRAAGIDDPALGGDLAPACAA